MKHTFAIAKCLSLMFFKARFDIYRAISTQIHANRVFNLIYPNGHPNHLHL
ncbi:hypothetical protein [Nostoc sp. EfeVER01]|uniref:hypothetical protein n=1 Tax=Nostoc sp. EfeVER01 TaxID=3075406 RepID=UPI00391D63F8